MNPSDRLKGRRVGGYEIVRVLGHGATASVFEGVHLALGKPVAIKILHEHVAADAQLRERFVREARTVARLRHPNIVDVIDVGSEGPMPYLVMDLLAGGDLRALLADVGSLEPKQAIPIVLPIASALAHAHDSGVLHRDLKPANVFLARDMRDDIVPTLVDFGLSKTTQDESAPLTETALVAGTALYMAPEVTIGVKNSSPASDQYSLGAILYEMVVGAPAFAPDAIYVVLERIRSASLVSPSARSARVPPALGEVILRAMHRDPAARFPGMRAFGAALLPFADEGTRRTFERDFAERASAQVRSGARASVPRVTAEAATRLEPRETKAAAVTLSSASSASSASPSLQPLVSFARTSAPLPCPAGTSPFRIKGLAYRGFVFMVGKAVPGGIDAFCEAVTEPSVREFLRQPFLAVVRYDVLPMVPLYAALASLTGAGFADLVRASTTAQCRYDARTAYRAIFTSDHVEDVADRISRFGAQYYDFGKYSGAIVGPGRLEIVHADVPEYLAAWQVPMFLAYTEECVRLLGARSVRTVSHAVTPAGRGGPKGDFPLVTMRGEFAWE